MKSTIKKTRNWYEIFQQSFILLIQVTQASVITYTSVFVSDVLLSEALMFLPLIIFPHAFAFFSVIKWVFVALCFLGIFKKLNKNKGDKSIFFYMFDSFIAAILFTVNVLKYINAFSYIKEKLFNPEKWKIVSKTRKFYNIMRDSVGGFIYAEYNTAIKIKKIEKFKMKNFTSYLWNYFIFDLFSLSFLSACADYIITLAAVINVLYVIPYVSAVMMMPVGFTIITSVILITMIIVNFEAEKTSKKIEQGDIVVKILSFIITLSVSIAFAHLTTVLLFSIPQISALVVLANNYNAYNYLFALTKTIFTISFTAEMQPEAYKGIEETFEFFENIVLPTSYEVKQQVEVKASGKEL